MYNSEFGRVKESISRKYISEKLNSLKIGESVVFDHSEFPFWQGVRLNIMKNSDKFFELGNFNEYNRPGKMTRIEFDFKSLKKCIEDFHSTFETD